MKNILATLLISAMFTWQSSAQQELNFSAGWGAENTFGNHGINVSAGYLKYIGVRFYAETHLRYFTSSLLNINAKKAKYFPEEERYYNVFFLPIHLGYSIGSPDAFHVNIQTGLAAFYQNYKIAYGHYFENGPNGVNRLVPEKTTYHQAREIKLAHSVGLSFIYPIKNKVCAGLGLDLYNHKKGPHFTQGYLLIKKRL